MNDILDEQEVDKNETLLTSNIILKSIIYFFTMIFGGILYMKLVTNYEPSLYNLMYGSLTFLCLFIFIGSILTMFQRFIKRRKDKIKNQKSTQDPFWFEAIEYGFSCYLVCMLIIVIGNYI